MQFHLIAFAIPLIFLLIGAEYYFSRLKQNGFYALTSSISNISIGIAERIAQLFLTGLFIWIFELVYRNFHFFAIPWTTWSWLVTFLFTDFMWYWYHRFSHQINLLWGAHIVHHQSEEFNLTVSLRVTIFQAFVRLGFGIALPLIGFPVPMTLVAISTLGVYQFFIHTRFIGSLGWLELVLVTPSHHRVHHGSNEQYLDKNYGGMLIVWDRLFGTFRKEEELVKFGLTKPVDSSSFLWLHFHFWLTMWANVKAAKTVRSKLKMLFGGPDLLNYDLEDALKAKYLAKSKKGLHVSRKNYPALFRYITLQVALSLVLLFVLYLLGYTGFSVGINTLITLFVLMTLVNCGAILEQKKWVFQLEIARLAVVSLCLIAEFHSPALRMALPALMIIVLAFYTALRRAYFQYFFSPVNSSVS